MQLDFLGTLFCAIGVVVAICLSVATDAEAADMVWTDAKTLTLEGKGWKDTKEPYDRLPAKSIGVVPESVTGLATNSAGMVIRFVTDSPNISVKWNLTSSTLAMPHMPATGVSGVDLYVKKGDKWQWMAIGLPQQIENTAQLVGGGSTTLREFALYLPLYNGVSDVQIGTDATSTVKPAPPRKGGNKPVVFYGTSITQGGCASRPGMAYSCILGRMLDIPTINLGFSGSGKAEHEVSDLLAELDPGVFVIDCLPNMQASEVDERIRYMLKAIKARHPQTPVILVENIIYQSAFATSDNPSKTSDKNPVLEKVYKDNSKDWNGKLYYIPCDKLTGTDGEATVDGVHMTDLGFLRMSQVMEPVIKRALGE